MIKGLRVDPGYMTQSIPDPAAAAAATVADCVKYGVNTIFAFAYSPVFGAYYYTQYEGAWAQTAYGASQTDNFMGQLISAAHAAGLKVVAYFPLNMYQTLAASNPSWQSLCQNLQPYSIAFGGYMVNPLCAWHPGYQTWFSGFIADALKRMPELDGIDASEGNVAAGFESGPGAPDYNPAAIQDFNQKYSGGQVGDDTWKQHRADGMTALHQLFLAAVRAAEGVQAYVTNGLVTVQFNETTLMPLDLYAQGCGFDWQAVANLGFDYLVQETIWQQLEQNAEALGTATGLFTPAWTASAIQQFAALLSGAPGVKLAHVEVTPFGAAPAPVVAPTPPQFQQALSLALAGAQGTSMYSYSQLKTNGADNDFAAALTAVYTAG